ncbi:class E sortase, partial [Streptomyces lunaelactis]|nr:class E sortase [Streptomyces lunaelactis]
MSVRLIVRTFSELCITVGTLIVLFVVYVLFWTGIKAGSATDGQIDKLQEEWSQGPVAAPAPEPTATP